MRVIGGYLKSKKIYYVKNTITRPLRDFVKENIFNKILHSKLIKPSIERANVLDIFSGTGSFGIECISRGAEKVTFVENNNLAFKILKQNLSHLSIIDKSKVVNQKIEHLLQKKINEKFNFFFFDPPFEDKSFVHNLKKIRDKKLFKKKHLIIIHRENKSIDNFENFFQTIEIKNYKRSKIIFGFFN